MSGPVLDPAALETNKAGRLTSDQQKVLRSMSRGLRRGEVQLAGAIAVIGLLVWFAPGPASAALTKPLVGIGALALAAAILIRGLAGADSTTNDLRSGKVTTVEGAVHKRLIRTEGRNSSSTSYYLDVEHVSVQAGRQAYEAAPDAGWMRLYYLPRSHRLVNFEHLPDHAVDPALLGSPLDALKSVGAGLFKGDEVARAEAMAQMAAMGNAMKPEEAAGVPAPSLRDAQPLQQSLVGEWTSGMFDVVFGEDGTVRLKTPMGMDRSGTWSVDASGHLVSDITGSQEATDASVVNGMLTISIGGRAVLFRRKA